MTINIPDTPASIPTQVLDRQALLTAEANAQTAVQAKDDAEDARDAAAGSASAAAGSLAASVALQSAVQIETVSASRFLDLNDAGKVLINSGAGAVTLTIPADTTTDFPVGSVIALWQIGTGTLVVDAEGGVTVTAPGSADTLIQARTATLIKVGADAWGIIGDVE
jgi:hypothetical protein